MTKEELKQKAYEYAIKEIPFIECITQNDLEILVQQAYITGAEPREKQIEIDAKQIRALQKQNGELTDKVNDLEDKLANADYQLEGRDNEIRELEQKLETERNSRIALVNKIAELEKENAELKGIKDVASLIKANNDTVITLMQLNNMLVSKSQQLTKAKEIIKTFLGFAKAFGYSPSMDKFITETKQFLKESE